MDSYLNFQRRVKAILGIDFCVGPTTEVQGQSIEKNIGLSPIQLFFWTNAESKERGFSLMDVKIEFFTDGYGSITNKEIYSIYRSIGLKKVRGYDEYYLPIERHPAGSLEFLKKKYSGKSHKYKTINGYCHYANYSNKVRDLATLRLNEVC